MTIRRPVLVAVLLTVTITLSACSSKDSTASNSGGNNSGSNPATSSTASESAALDATSPAAALSESVPAGSSAPDVSPATSGPAPAASAAPKPGSTVAAGRCSSLDQKAAESILGFATKAGLSSPAGAAEGGMKKVDGCFYGSKGDGSLGYDVVQVTAQLGQAMIGAQKGRMSESGTRVTPFELGLPDSVAFTMAIGTGVDSQVGVLAGDKFITVSVARKDGNTAKAQASVTAAAKQLAASA